MYFVILPAVDLFYLRNGHTEELADPAEVLGDDELKQMSEMIATKVLAKITARLSSRDLGHVSQDTGEPSRLHTSDEGRLLKHKNY